MAWIVWRTDANGHRVYVRRAGDSRVWWTFSRGEAKRFATEAEAAAWQTQLELTAPAVEAGDDARG